MIKAGEEGSWRERRGGKADTGGEEDPAGSREEAEGVNKSEP